jgi:hypothetical protein
MDGLPDKLKPAVSGRWLLLLAGLMWTTVGAMLCRMAYIWLSAVAIRTAVILAAVGIALGLAGYRFSFIKLARKNSRRICQMADKSCVFAFQAWKSYLIIAFMIGLGIFLRHSAFPRHYLAVIYLAVGLALLLSSLLYYGLLWRVLFRGYCCGAPAPQTKADRLPKLGAE